MTAILFCNCGGNAEFNSQKENIKALLKTFPAQIFELNDLCALAVERSNFFINLQKQYTKVIIIACYERAIAVLFEQYNIDMPNYKVLNFKEDNNANILAKLKKDITEDTANNYQVVQAELDVPAWFPIVEKSKCTLCGQCAKFCMFGVYKYNKKELNVVNPLSCKNNCPACGRTCPAGAIIFPKLSDKNMLAGANENKANATQAKPLFTMLQNRNAMRKSIFKPEALIKAEAERQAALDEMKKKENN